MKKAEKASHIAYTCPLLTPPGPTLVLGFSLTNLYGASGNVLSMQSTFFSTPSSVTTQLYYHLLHFVENRFELMIHSNEIFFA